MASEMLNEILNAEKNAAQSEQSARDKAGDIIDNAHKQAETIVAEALLEAQKNEKVAMVASQMQSAVIESDAITEAVSTGEKIKISAQAKLNQAVQTVSNYILS